MTVLRQTLELIATPISSIDDLHFIECAPCAAKPGDIVSSETKVRRITAPRP